MASNHAVLELPNNFISPTQMIGGCQIPAIRFGVSVAPTEKPDFKGQIYFSKYNGDAFLFIANGVTLDDWEAIYFPNDRGDVFKGKSNNFVDSLQTILNRQIATIHFIDEQTPASIPNFAGQLVVSKYGGKLTLFVAVDGANWSQLSGDGGTMPDVSNFAKLDSANDFKDIQSVKGNAIVTVINGTHADPNGNVTPDYPGQLYIYEDETNKVTDYYISDANGGWDMLNEEINTANFVRTNITNNFESAEQTILKNQIVTVIVKAVPPNEQPKFIGQVYLDTSKTDSNVYLAISRSLSPDGANWVCLNTPANMPDEVVREDLTNNFTVQRQQINGNQIASILHGSTPPPAADSQHLGRVYVENDGTNIKAYICVPTGELTYEYKPITATVGNEYARKDKVNNFIAVDDQGDKEGQLIHGNPSMSVIVRDGLPDATNIRPEFKGQLYIYRKPLNDGSGEYDTAMWIADDGTSKLQWTPLQRNWGNIFFRKDIENKITWPVQIMQMEDNTDSIEFIMGAKRIKGLPTTLKPSRVGEVVISEMDFTPPTPSIYRVFIALSDREGDWLKVSDSSVDIVALEERVDVLEGHKDSHSTKIGALETTTSDHNLRIGSQENSLRDAWAEINTQKTVTNASFDGRIKDINMEVIEVSNQLITLEPLKNKSITSLELDSTNNKLIGKNIAGEVVSELALPSVSGLVTVNSIALSRTDSKIIPVGDNLALSVIYTPSSATLRAVNFTTSDETIATISDIGVINMVGEGAATITATYIQGGFSSSIRVLGDGPGTNYDLKENTQPNTTSTELGTSADTYCDGDLSFSKDGFVKNIYVGVTGYNIGDSVTGRIMSVDMTTKSISNAYNVTGCRVISVDGTEGIPVGKGATQQLKIPVPDSVMPWLSEKGCAIRVVGATGKGLALKVNDGTVTNGYFSTSLPGIGAALTFGTPAKVGILAFQTVD